MPSIKKNFAYSSFLTISGYLFPLITYPYVTRVLGVDGLGICNFVSSIIHYGILFSMMGIGTLAIREIAQFKSDRKQLSIVFSSLLTINLITSFLITFVILYLAFFIPRFQEYQELLIIGSAQIIFNSLLIEWLYKGLENFKYITIRSLLIKILYVFAIFLFVKTPNDYLVYFSINVGMVIVNAIVNIIYSRHFLSFSFRELRIKPYVKPFCVLGLYNILTSMYTTFNVTYLGLSCGNIEVGYYTTATKLYTLVLLGFTAFTSVMMPRLSSLLSEGKTKEFMRLSNKSVNVLLACIMPFVVFVQCYADDIIFLIAGVGFEGAVLPLRIIVPLLLVIGYEQIIVIQMLMPLKKDKVILFNSIIGASIGVFLNILLVPFFKSTGSAIVLVLSETTIMILSQHFISKEISFYFPWRKLISRLLWTCPIVITCLLIRAIIDNYLVELFLGFDSVCLYYILLEYIVYKNEYIELVLKKISKIK